MAHVTIPSALLANDAHDLAVINLLKAAGIPATGVKSGIVSVSSGTLEQSVSDDEAIFTFTAAPVAPTAQETEIASLQAQHTADEQQIATLTAQHTADEAKLEAAEKALEPATEPAK